MDNKAIIVTESAKNKLKELISGNKDAIGVRIEILSGGCAGFKYRFNYLTEIKDDDLITDLGDIKIVMDNHSCTKMFGTELDYITDENFSSKFVFNNPNSKSNCGCGKSFGV